MLANSSVVSYAQDVYLFDIIPREEVPDSIFDQSRIYGVERIFEGLPINWETRWVYFMKFRKFNMLTGGNFTVSMDWPIDPDSTTFLTYLDVDGSVRLENGDTSRYIIFGSESNGLHPFSQFNAQFNSEFSARLEWLAAPILTNAFSFDEGLNPTYGFFMQGVDSILQPALSTRDEELLNTGLRIGPNPVVDELKIFLEDYQGGMFTIAIYNELGQLALSDQKKSSSLASGLDVSHLSKGRYTIVVAPLFGRPMRMQFLKL